MATTIALAGRRIDPPDAETPRFPLANIALVRDRLRAFFVERGADTLVCSAACGADLVALEAAEALGMRRRVVLPFDPAKFRETSVTDRPGDWGPIFDRLVEAALQKGELVVLENAGEGGAAYATANSRIIEEAAAMPGARSAAIVWEGRPRGDDDATAGFADEARGSGLAVETVLTL
jgi:hypothetical protein